MIVLQLTAVKRIKIERPKHCPYCQGETFQRWGQVKRRIRTSNMLERVSQEIKRRTRVVWIFSNSSACLRLVSALLMEIIEDWETGRIY